MTSVSVEDYLVTIYRLQGEEHPVSTMALADQLKVAPPSVTGMLRKLDTLGDVSYEPYHGVVLTKEGEQAALRLLRRHRLWELFLTEVLGLPRDEVHVEAHRLEHATSDRVANLLDEFLQQPEVDPHGHRIPRPDGSLPARDSLSLTEVRPGQWVQVVEVPDGDPAVLRQLTDLGIQPGLLLQVAWALPSAQVVTVRLLYGEQGRPNEIPIEWPTARRIRTIRAEAEGTPS